MFKKVHQSDNNNIRIKAAKISMLSIFKWGNKLSYFNHLSYFLKILEVIEYWLIEKYQFKNSFSSKYKPTCKSSSDRVHVLIVSSSFLSFIAICKCSILRKRLIMEQLTTDFNASVMTQVQTLQRERKRSKASCSPMFILSKSIPLVVVANRWNIINICK